MVKMDILVISYLVTSLVPKSRIYVWELSQAKCVSFFWWLRHVKKRRLFSVLPPRLGLASDDSEISHAQDWDQKLTDPSWLNLVLWVCTDLVLPFLPIQRPPGWWNLFLVLNKSQVCEEFLLPIRYSLKILTCLPL